MAEIQNNETPETTMSKVSETRRMYLAYLIWVSFVAFITFVSIRPVQLPGDTLGIIIGSLTTFVGVVITYYFSTSLGSTAKSVIMGNMNRAPGVSVTPQPDSKTTVTTETPKP